MNFSHNYPLKPFRQTDFAKIQRTIAEFPLATLISQAEKFPVVSQVPLYLDESGKKLFGHFDRNNPHCEQILSGGPIYCLFNGPNHYMTPSIYPDEQYPGWNYVAIHMQGQVRTVASQEKLVEILLRTGALNEPENSDYELTTSQRNFELFSTLILGFEIEIAAWQGVFKLAQDKGPDHALLAARHLSEMIAVSKLDYLIEMLA